MVAIVENKTVHSNAYPKSAPARVQEATVPGPINEAVITAPGPIAFILSFQVYLDISFPPFSL